MQSCPALPPGFVTLRTGRSPPRALYTPHTARDGNMVGKVIVIVVAIVPVLEVTLAAEISNLSHSPKAQYISLNE